MKRFFIFYVLLQGISYAQIGIGTSTLESSARLQIDASSSTNAKGLLPPRVALTATNSISPFTATPASGILIYNTASAGSSPNTVTPGFYYWSGTAWIRLVGPSDNVANITGTVGVANGGTGSATATGARTNLGATTVGSNLFTLTNPSAVTFPRINANNTVSALNAADFRTAIGAGTSSTSGTVTSVGLSLPSIFSVSNSPVTSSGTLTGELATQSPNTVFAGPPSGSAAAPTFRSLVVADIPTLNQNTTGTASNVTGTVAVVNGGTGTTNGSITGTGALTFTAGGTNQNIILKPSGTGTVGVGSSASPDASAQLDVNSTSKGFLPPRVSLTSTTAAGPITSPATGLLVFNTATAGTSPNNVVPGYYYNSGTSSSPVWKRLAPVEVDNTFKLVSTGTALNVNTSQDLSWGSWITLNNSRIQVIVPSGFSTNRIILQWNVWGDVNSSNQAYGSLRFQISQSSPSSSTVTSVMMTSWNIMSSSGGQARWAVPVGYILENVSAGSYTFDLQVKREVEGGNITSYKMWGVAGNAQVFVQ